jgi:cobalt/nickel transport system permease protein
LDVRARLIVAILFSVTVVVSQQISVLLCACSISGLFAILAKLDWKQTAKKLLALNTFIIYLLIFLPFTVHSENHINILSFKASWQGMRQAIEIGLTANSIVLILFSLVSNLSSSELGSGLLWFKVPIKLIQLIQFTLRYLSVIQEEFNRLRRAMRARAFSMCFGWHTWRSIAHLIAMMIIRSMQRADRIFNAMKCRGYQGQVMICHYEKWQRRDSFFLFLSCVLCLLIIGTDNINNYD